MPIVQLKTVHAQPIAAGGLRLILESQALVVRLPFGGFVWHRPTAVAIEPTGTRVPIHDFTRIAQLGLLVLTVLWLIASR
jgi:hypothetical protein